MRRVFLLAVLACCTVAPAAHAEVLATVDRPTPIAAYDGRVVWSQRTPAGDAFQLMSRVGGVTEAVPVPTRQVPFDVDLGPAADGSVVAVYSRCTREGPAGGFILVNYLAGRSCDIYRYDFASGREAKVDEVSSPRANEAWPTFWRPRLAFARAYDNKRAYPYLYVNALGDAQGSTRMPGGPRNTCARNRNTGRMTCTDARRSLPLDLELYGRRLAFVWRYTDFAEGFAYDLRIDDVLSRTGMPRRLVRQGGGGLTAIVLGGPGFEAGRIYWSAACFGDPAGCPGRRALVRSPYLGGTAPQTFDPRTSVFAHDRAAGITYILQDTFGGGGGTECRGDPDVPGGTCQLVTLTPTYS